MSSNRAIIEILLIVCLGVVMPARALAQTFNDVPTDYWAFSFIEKLAANGITAGCGGGSYCPEDSVTRAQMAVFLERGMNGSGFSPPAASGSVFLDVGTQDFAANFIEQFFLDGITAGCGNNNYCPEANVTRDQMAVFLLRAKYGSGFSPPSATGIFNDVPVEHWAAGWIEQLAAEGITAGCSGGNYCPEDTVTRAQMAVFLVRTFNLQGPPVADDLSVAVDYGSQIASATVAIDPEGDALSFEVVDSPAKGDLVINVDGTFTYTPTVFQIDTDSFTFRASDGQLNSNVATVDISITRSAEISAKYDLREQRNTHWAENVNANPGKNVIDNDVAVIDLDNDGDEDVLVTQFIVSSTDPGDSDFYEELETVLFRNIGNAYVKEATGLFINMRGYTVSDFNGDGLEDIFFGNQGHDFDPFSGGQDRLLIQNGDGTLSDLTSSNLPAGVFFTHAVCSGDFDTDGDTDLYVAALTPSEHRIYENDGAGVFTDATTTLLPPEMQLMIDPPNPRVSFQWCEVADFNLDGRDDLILGQRDFGRSEEDTVDVNDTLLLDSLVVLYGSNQNTLVTDYAIGLLPVDWDGPTEGTNIQDIEVADFDQDNCLDVVVESTNDPQASQGQDFAANRSVYLGDCAGGFGDPFDYTDRMVVESANTLLVTDFNGDGFPDFSHRYGFDAYIDGGLELPPVSTANYHPRAYINKQSLAEPFAVRGLTTWDVEQLKIDEFLGLIHNSLP